MRKTSGRKALLVMALLLVVSASGCGSATPSAKEPESDATEGAHREHHGPQMGMKTELGEIDPKETQKTFDRLQGEFQNCYRSGLKKIEYLGGDVKFFLRVGEDGKIKYAYLEDSTLGDRETEKCMLDAITRADWPRPKGGEAEVRNGLSFDAPGDVRPPTQWSADKVAGAAEKHASDLERCKSGASGSFRVTAYVEPNGKTGRVLAVGVAPPNKDAADKVDCVTEVVKSIKLPSPGSYAAKVTFPL